MIITSSIAGASAGGSSMAYSVTKAAQIHLMRCLAATQGPKVRVNAVLPGLLLTDWGRLYSAEAIKAMEERAILKKATNLEDCADTYVSIAQNTSMTGQRIAVGMLSDNVLPVLKLTNERRGAQHINVLGRSRPQTPRRD